MARKNRMTNHNNKLWNSDRGQQTSSNISKKSKIRYLLVRSENYEKQIVELLQSISAYTRRTAKLRDTGDTVAETLNCISIAEVLNPSSKKTVMEVSKTFRIIQDHRDSEILYLEDKLLPLISEYGETLQKQREELRSNSGKIFYGKERGLSWIRSSNTNNQTLKRRSQSVERLDRSGKEEKIFQHSIQRYELKKNLILKKLLMKLILSELRFTIRSFNNLTYLYKHILDEMNPTKDLKFFNDFFNFQPFRKSNINEMEDDANELDKNDYDSDNDEADEQTDLDDEEEDEDDKNNESMLNNQWIKNEKSVISRSSDDENDGRSRTKSTISTLKRFNSTPEIIINNKNVLDLLERKDMIQSNNNSSNNKNSSSSNEKKKIHLLGTANKLVKNRFQMKSSRNEMIQKKDSDEDDEDEDDDEDDNKNNGDNEDTEEEDDSDLDKDLDERNSLKRQTLNRNKI